MYLSRLYLGLRKISTSLPRTEARENKEKHRQPDPWIEPAQKWGLASRLPCRARGGVDRRIRWLGTQRRTQNRTFMEYGIHFVLYFSILLGSI